MAEQLSGVISKVGDRGTSFQLEGDFSWYSAFNPEQLCGAKAGDSVSFMFATKQDKNDPNKVYKNLRGNLTIHAGSPDPQPNRAAVSPLPSAKKGEPSLTRVRLILRQNALTNAVNYCTPESSPEQVLEIAKLFEGWTSGDTDSMKRPGSDPPLEKNASVYSEAFEGVSS